MVGKLHCGMLVYEVTEGEKNREAENENRGILNPPLLRQAVNMSKHSITYFGNRSQRNN